MSWVISLGYPLVVFIYGAVIGSFLNVVILRHIARRPVTGRSACPTCGHVLGPLDLIPLASFIGLGGRCRYCDAPIAAQYPLVELASGLLFLGFLVPVPATPLSAAQAVGALILSLLLVVLFVIDLKTFLLPDVFLGLLAGVAVIWRLLPGNQQSWPVLFLAVAVGSGFLLLLWVLTRGRGIGLGDVKLLIPLGLVAGWPNVVVLLWLAFMAGGLVGIWLWSTGRAGLKTAIPFGPFLAASAIILLLWPALPAHLLGWWFG